MKKVIKEGYDRYFVAIVPSEPILSEIQEMKEKICNDFQSCASLNSPPHITLHMPFLWKRKKRDLLLKFFNAFKPDIKRLNLKTAGIDSFGERVIFLGIEENKQLEEFQKMLTRAMKVELNLFNAAYKDRAYHPHITLAYRDLKKKNFEPAYQSINELAYQAEFSVVGFSLLHYKYDQWISEQFYSFNS